MAFSILSLNAWGGHVHQPLLAYLAGLDVDMLCLQEVTRGPGDAGDGLVYRDQNVELPQRADLYGEVKALMPMRQPFFCPMARGPLFKGADEIQTEFGLASFLRADLAVVDQAIGFIHGEFSPHGWAPHPRSRNAHGLRFHDPVTDMFLTVVHLHGLRDPAGKHDTPARHAQAQALLAFLRRIWNGKDGLVVCGDFNLLPDSHTFALLAEALGLVDLVTTRGFSDTRTSLYPKPGRYADYMLVTPNVDVLDFDCLAAPEVSDHRALKLVLA